MFRALYNEKRDCTKINLYSPKILAVAVFNINFRNLLKGIKNTFH